MARIKVLSIVGPGRSGTTVLAGILGEVEGVVDVGELRWLWRRGLLERRTCGCGVPVDECPVWSAVASEVMTRNSGSVRKFAAEIATAQDILIARRHRIRVIRSATTSERWPSLEAVRTATAHLVQATADVTGARLIVDSSKRAQDAAVMAALDGVDHYVLHMVRDPGAVAFSWAKKNKTIRVAEGTRAMGTRGVLSSVTRWTENSLGAALLRRHVPAERWMFLRYEDFAAQPRAAVERILAFTGADGEPPFAGDDVVDLGVNHTVAGNPNRFRAGRVTIALDSEWTRRMPRRRQVLVRALTWPLLLKFGYPLVRRPDDVLTASPAQPSAEPS